MCRPVIGVSNRQSEHRPAKLKYFDALPIFSIVETSTGNLVTSAGLPTGGTSKPAVESADHQAISFEVCRRTPDDLQIQRVDRLQRSSPDVWQMPGRFVHDCLPIDVAAHSTSIVFQSLKCDRHARPDQKSPIMLGHR